MAESRQPDVYRLLDSLSSTTDDTCYLNIRLHSSDSSTSQTTNTPIVTSVKNGMPVASRADLHTGTAARHESSWVTPRSVSPSKFLQTDKPLLIPHRLEYTSNIDGADRRLNVTMQASLRTQSGATQRKPTTPPFSSPPLSSPLPSSPLPSPPLLSSPPLSYAGVQNSAESAKQHNSHVFMAQYSKQRNDTLLWHPQRVEKAAEPMVVSLRRGTGSPSERLTPHTQDNRSTPTLNATIIHHGPAVRQVVAQAEGPRPKVATTDTQTQTNQRETFHLPLSSPPLSTPPLSSPPPNAATFSSLPLSSASVFHPVFADSESTDTPPLSPPLGSSILAAIPSGEASTLTPPTVSATASLHDDILLRHSPSAVAVRATEAHQTSLPALSFLLDSRTENAGANSPTPIRLQAENAGLQQNTPIGARPAKAAPIGSNNDMAEFAVSRWLSLPVTDSRICNQDDSTISAMQCVPNPGSTTDTKSCKASAASRDDEQRKLLLQSLALLPSSTSQLCLRLAETCNNNVRNDILAVADELHAAQEELLNESVPEADFEQLYHRYLAACDARNASSVCLENKGEAAASLLSRGEFRILSQCFDDVAELLDIIKNQPSSQRWSVPESEQPFVMQHPRMILRATLHASANAESLDRDTTMQALHRSLRSFRSNAESALVTKRTELSKMSSDIQQLVSAIQLSRMAMLSNDVIPLDELTTMLLTEPGRARASEPILAPADTKSVRAELGKLAKSFARREYEAEMESKVAALAAEYESQLQQMRARFDDACSEAKQDLTTRLHHELHALNTNFETVQKHTRDGCTALEARIHDMTACAQKKQDLRQVVRCMLDKVAPSAPALLHLQMSLNRAFATFLACCIGYAPYSDSLARLMKAVMEGDEVIIQKFAANWGRRPVSSTPSRRASTSEHEQLEYHLRSKIFSKRNTPRASFTAPHKTQLLRTLEQAPPLRQHDYKFQAGHNVIWQVAQCFIGNGAYVDSDLHKTDSAMHTSKTGSCCSPVADNASKPTPDLLMDQESPTHDIGIDATHAASIIELRPTHLVPAHSETKIAKLAMKSKRVAGNTARNRSPLHSRHRSPIRLTDSKSLWQSLFDGAS